MKNTNFSQLDTNQIINRKFDESQDADRVILVGGEKLEISIDSDKIANAVKEGLNNFNFMSENVAKLDTPTQFQSIEKNVFIPQIEIKTIEVPVIVKEIEYREIEKPIYIEKVVTIEKPVVIKEIEIKEVFRERYYPLEMKLAAIVQAVCMVALLLISLLKK
jgi:hypothetical protein